LAQEHAPVKVTRLYTGEDGLSHFEQVSVKFSAVPDAPNTVEESEPVSMKKSYVVRIAPGFFEGWHNADVRRYVITISGRLVENLVNRELQAALAAHVPHNREAVSIGGPKRRCSGSSAADLATRRAEGAAEAAGARAVVARGWFVCALATGACESCVEL
jgi:hypothetical protein